MHTVLCFVSCETQRLFGLFTAKMRKALELCMIENKEKVLMYWNMVDHPLRMLKDLPLAYDFYAKFSITRVLDKHVLHRNILLKRALKKGEVEKREILTNDAFNEELKEEIRSGKPLFVCRYGTAELNACTVCDFVDEKYTDAITSENMHKLKMNTGVFPESREMYRYFAETYMDALKTADYSAYWGNALVEEYFLRKYFSPDVKLMPASAIQPFRNYEQPWTVALEGKRVLVVHPFASEIRSQYKRRTELFENKGVLPEFELTVVQAIQSSGTGVPEGYSDWKGALNQLFCQCQQHDYDVALLGCGSYAVPLGAMMKNAGKQAIVLGSAIQILFGIKGKRWDDGDPAVVAMYNDSWIRAGQSTLIRDADKKADGASYW